MRLRKRLAARWASDGRSSDAKKYLEWGLLGHERVAHAGEDNATGVEQKLAARDESTRAYAEEADAHRIGAGSAIAVVTDPRLVNEQTSGSDYSHRKVSMI